MKRCVCFFFLSVTLSFIMIVVSKLPKVDAYVDINQSNKFAKNINLNKAKNIMIVAHPDDETIWGGDHLIEEDYLVVCVTCGTNKVRDNEIKKALSISDDELIKLGYPDNPGGIVNDWSEYKESIEEDLSLIITMKNYDKIVTHNQEGEYGHIHHKMINNIVTKISVNNALNDKLYFFAKYYKKENIDVNINLMFPIKNYYTKMYKMVKVYKSQSFIENAFSHVMTSEKWQKYSETVESSASKSLNN